MKRAPRAHAAWAWLWRRLRAVQRSYVGPACGQHVIRRVAKRPQGLQAKEGDLCSVTLPPSSKRHPLTPGGGDLLYSGLALLNAAAWTLALVAAAQYSSLPWPRR